MPVPRLHIIGRKNSGKTTLITDLIAYFITRGKRVGSIKHTHHRHELDVPGKDSYKHREAGASPVAIVSPGMTAVFRPNPTGIASDGYAWLEPMWEGCDLVLIEGDSQTPLPKVEVWRQAVGDVPIAVQDQTILAVISDDPIPTTGRHWCRTPLETLADQLEEWLKSSNADNG
jgi:molybdopterin-guanine dinucleotide biosynthesis adapter protein